MRYTIGVQRELPGQWLVEGAYVGSRGWDLTTGGGARRARSISTAFPPSTSRPVPSATTRRTTSSMQQVTNPFSGSDSRHGVQRRNHRASAAAPAVSALRQRPDVRGRWHEPLQLGAVQDREAIHAGLHDSRGLHLVEVHRARLQAESDRHRVRGAAVGVRRAAPFRRQRDLGAAVRPRSPVGQRRQSARRWSHRRVERAGHRSAAERPADQLPRPQHLFQRRSEQPEDRLLRRHEQSGVRHQRVLLPRCRGADQRRGRSGEAAQRSAHPAREQHAVFPVTRRRACAVMP